jgi:hypothetical protein
MENLSRDVGKNVKHGSASFPSKVSSKGKRWTVLFIHDDGKIVTVPWIMPAFYFLLICLIVAIAVSGTFFFLYDLEKDENAGLKREMSQAQNRLNKLEGEKEILLARVVMAESRANTFAPGNATGNSGEKGTGESSGMETAEGTDDSKTGQGAVPPIPQVLSDLISVETPEVNFDQARKEIHVQLKVSNKGSESKPVAGYVFVTMLPDNTQAKSRIVLPPATFGQGRPTPHNRGQYFSIARFMTLNFKKEFQGEHNQIRNLTAFVFSKTGEMILTQSFPIKVGVR